MDQESKTNTAFTAVALHYDSLAAPRFVVAGQSSQKSSSVIAIAQGTLSFFEI
jgi:hypothetical protein